MDEKEKAKGRVGSVEREGAIQTDYNHNAVEVCPNVPLPVGFSDLAYVAHPCTRAHARRVPSAP